MDIKKGRRKSFDIEFVIVTLENLDEVAAWSGGSVGGEEKTKHVHLNDKAAINQQQTKAFVGDVVVKSGETRTYKKFTRKAFNKAFEETREEVIHKSSVDGKFVSELEALANPKETISQEVTMVPKSGGGISIVHPDELPRDADPS